MMSAPDLVRAPSLGIVSLAVLRRRSRSASRPRPPAGRATDPVLTRGARSTASTARAATEARAKATARSPPRCGPSPPISPRSRGAPDGKFPEERVRSTIDGRTECPRPRRVARCRYGVCLSPTAAATHRQEGEVDGGDPARWCAISRSLQRLKPARSTAASSLARRTVSTGQGACCTTRLATEPKTSSRRPLRPCVPIAIRSTSRSLASRWMTDGRRSFGRPRSSPSSPTPRARPPTCRARSWRRAPLPRGSSS